MNASEDGDAVADLAATFGRSGLRWLRNLTRTEAQLVLQRGKEAVSHRRRAKRASSEGPAKTIN